MKEQQISRRAFLGKLRNVGKIAIASPLILKLLESKAKAGVSDGFLRIENYVDSTIGANELRVMHYNDSGVSDGYDSSFDVTFGNLPSNKCALYSDISDIEPTNNKLRSDYRLPSSTKDFLIQLVYKGSLAHAKDNYLEFSYFDEINLFGDKPILFQSDLLPYGPVVDVRKAIAENSGIVQLKDLPFGDYSPNTPYGSGILTIGTRLLADITNEEDGRVDFRDFAVLAQDWKKPQGQYVGDISGPNGIPDGYVDVDDLSAFSDEWLADVNDPNTW